MNPIDQHLFLWINLTAQSPAALMGLARFGATVLPSVLLGALILTLLVGSPHWRRATVHMLLAMLLAWLVVRGIGAVWPTPRPFVLGLGEQWMAKGASPSFPSSHATIAWTVALAGCLWTPNAWLRAAFVLTAVLIGWARIAMGVHFPLDVIGGMVVAAACVWASRPAVAPLADRLGARFRARPARTAAQAVPADRQRRRKD
jgi:undecaprenyl-diphosphatase